MSNTLQPQAPQKAPRQYYPSYSNLITTNKAPPSIKLTILLLLVCACECRQTLLLSSLSTKTDQILFRILKETNYLLKSTRKVNNRQLNCYSIIKNDLVTNPLQKYQPLNYSITHTQSLQYTRDYPNNILTPQEALYHEIDKILNSLNGICLYYRTNTFISQYCHKEHFRQYDDDFTKFYNQKQLFEDFKLGYFKKEEVQKNQENINQIPVRSVFAKKYNHLLVQSIDNQNGKVQMQQNYNGRILQTTSHVILTNSYLLAAPTFIELTCLDHTSSKEQQINQIKNIALAVGPYEFVYTQKLGICDQLISFVQLQKKITYQSQQRIRVYGQFLYGDIEDICTQSWNWQRAGKEYQDAQLVAGSTLSIQYISEEGKMQTELVTVKHVINSELVELEEKLGVTFYKTKTPQLLKPYKGLKIISKIHSCNLLFSKSIQKQNKLQDNHYLKSNFMTFSETTNSIQLQGKQFGCICSLEKQGVIHPIDMDIAIGKRLWLNYYRIYLQTNSLIYLYRQFKDTVFRQCLKIDCYSFVGEQKQPYPPKEENKYTQMIKLNYRNKIFNFTTDIQNHIFIINIHRSGIIKLRTIDSKGNQFTYILSESQILKIRQYQNGTKQIIKQNKYYENITRNTQTNIQNYLYLHCFVLPNGTISGALWKYHDYLYFPRFILFDEKLISLQHRSGYTYLRKLDPSKMQKKQSLSILNYVKILQQNYLWGVKPIPEQLTNKPLFLNTSYSINYTYEGGQFCGPPISKHRQTLVTLKCGRAWFQITKVHETQPCSYWVQIQTTLLCRQNFKDVVQSDEQIPSKTDSDKVIFSGVTCLKEEGIYNQAYPLIYPGKSLLKQR